MKSSKAITKSILNILHPTISILAKHLKAILFIFSQHYLDLDKYEPSLYKNVEEITSLITRPAPEGDAKNVLT